MSVHDSVMSHYPDEYYLDKLESDANYYWTIWSVFEERVFKYCRFTLGVDHHDAEDLCSEAMLKGYQSLPKAKKTTNITALFYRICKCTYYDLIRKKSTHKKHEEALQEDGAEVELRQFFAKERAIATLAFVKGIIENLPAVVSEICLCYFFEGGTYKDISSAYQCQESYARKQIHRVRKVLAVACRRYLNDY